jgi:hypothetical protein
LLSYRATVGLRCRHSDAVVATGSAGCTPNTHIEAIIDGPASPKGLIGANSYPWRIWTA